MFGVKELRGKPICRAAFKTDLLRRGSRERSQSQLFALDAPQAFQLRVEDFLAFGAPVIETEKWNQLWLEKPVQAIRVAG